MDAARVTPGIATGMAKTTCTPANPLSWKWRLATLESCGQEPRLGFWTSSLEIAGILPLRLRRKLGAD
jgi:hypothetical protein